MPASTYDQKCHRFNELRSQMAAILNAPREEGKGLTAEEVAKFDTLAAEAKVLKNEILGADDETKRRRTLTELEEAADAPRGNRPSADQIQSELRQSHSDFDRGRYSLRYLKKAGGSGGKSVHELAYEQGLAILARCGQLGQREWAENKLKARGISLATISPFQSEDGSSSGGYLIFPEFEATLINLKEQYGVIQQKAFRIPMASDTFIVPRRAGGTAVYYPGENTQLAASAMQFDQVQLIAQNTPNWPCGRPSSTKTP